LKNFQTFPGFSINLRINTNAVIIETNVRGRRKNTSTGTSVYRNTI